MRGMDRALAFLCTRNRTNEDAMNEMRIFFTLLVLSTAAVADHARTNSSKEKKMVVKQHIKNVVLVHGAFADGSGWKAVADILKKDGYKVSVAQPPETSYADDQKYTKAAIDAMAGPVVLVGHSYAGPSLPHTPPPPTLTTPSPFSPP